MMKELLCIPYGGLNDTLVQISRCYEYAKIYKRQLLIDTSKSGIFLDFGLYFEFNPPIPEPCGLLIVCCLSAQNEDDLIGDCAGCDCSPLEQSPRRFKSLGAAAPKKKAHTCSHTTPSTFILFPVSESSRQLVFIDSESAYLTPSERISEILELAKRGMLDKLIVKMKVGDAYVTITDKV